MPGPSAPIRFRVRPGRVAVLLASITGMLALGHVVAHVLYWRWGVEWGFGLLPKFSLDAEEGFGTFFAGLLLVLCALLLLLNGRSAGRRGERPVWPWKALAVVFVLLAVDETCSIHELSTRPLQEGLGLGGFLTYAWVIPAGVFLVVTALVFGRFVIRLPARTRALFLAAGALYLLGVLGIEVLEGRHVDLHGSLNPAFAWYVLVEETLEMTGLIVFVYALLDALEPSEVRVDISRVSPPGSGERELPRS